MQWGSGIQNEGSWILKPILAPLCSARSRCVCFLTFLSSGIPLLFQLLSPVKLSKPACWVLAGSGFLTNKVTRFQPLLPPGKKMFPSPSVFWKRSRNDGPSTCLSDGILPRTEFPLALSPLFFFLSLWENLAQCRVLCPWGLQASPKQPNPQWGLCFHLLEVHLQEGRGWRGDGLDLPLGSHLPWPTTSQALAHFLSAGNSQA